MSSWAELRLSLLTDRWTVLIRLCSGLTASVPRVSFRWIYVLLVGCCLFHVWGFPPPVNIVNRAYQMDRLRMPIWSFYSKTYFKNTKNLFIHIALIPEGDNPRVNPNILKCLLHSPVAKGYRLVVIASRAMVCKTPTYYLILNSVAFARGCVILRSHILFPLLLILLISHHI